MPPFNLKQKSIFDQQRAKQFKSRFNYEDALKIVMGDEKKKTRRNIQAQTFIDNIKRKEERLKQIKKKIKKKELTI